MAVKLKDIAEMAGVSIGTVDRALHNRGRVKPEVSERIKEIANELNYKPNTVARGLTIQRKNLKIAVIFHIHKINDFFQDVLEGCQNAKTELEDFGVEVKEFYCKDFDAESQLLLIDQAVKENYSAIVLVPICSDIIRDKLNELYANEFPVILLTNIIDNCNFVSFIGCNYYAIGQLTAGLLHLMYRSGCNLTLFSPSLKMLGHVLRVKGLKDRIEEAYQNIHLSDVCELPGNQIDDYKIAVQELTEESKPDVIVCPSGNPGVLKAVQDASVEDRPRIITYDFVENIQEKIINSEVDATIVQHAKLQGYQAVMTAFHYLVNKNNKIDKYQYLPANIILPENIGDLDA